MKMLACRSKRSDLSQLRIFMRELPPEGYAIQRTKGYRFAYRPPPERGKHRVTVPQSGLSQHRTSSDHGLLVPPNVSTELEWTNANGRVAHLVFSPRLPSTTAAHLGLSGLLSGRFTPIIFTFDQRLEALCKLLVDKTEYRCRLALHYFESLARASTVSLLRVRRDPPPDERRSVAVPPGIRRVIDWLEEHFAGEACLKAVEDFARLIARHFPRRFSRRHRLHPPPVPFASAPQRARQLITRPTLTELAAACGFCDQAHLAFPTSVRHDVGSLSSEPRPGAAWPLINHFPGLERAACHMGAQRKWQKGSKDDRMFSKPDGTRFLILAHIARPRKETDGDSYLLLRTMSSANT